MPPRFKPHPSLITGGYLADMVIQRMHDTHHLILKETGNLDAARRAAAVPAPPGPLTINVPRGCMLSGQRLNTLIFEYAAHLRWNASMRTVYDIHPDLQDTLTRAETKNTVPAEILKRLPHPDPLIVFPRGLSYVAVSRDRLVLRAAHIVGKRDSQRLASTHDPEATAYRMVVISDVIDEHGTIVDNDLLTVTIPLINKPTSIGELVDSVLTSFVWDPSAPPSNDEVRKHQALTTVVTFVLSHLLYLCSHKPDIAVKPVKKKTASTGANKSAKPMHVSAVGWHIGPTIAAARKRYERDPVSVNPDGPTRTIAPHVRQCHFHTVRYGPGRRDARVDWYPPSFVNFDKPRTSSKGTIRPVTE